MADDLFDYDEDEPAPKKRDNLFIWTVFILLLIGLAFACWLGSFYIFGHPEQARNYRILQRVKKIDPPKRFEETKAPAGDFFTAQRLLEKYGKFSDLQLERENAELLRTFVTNYRETKKLVPYVRGNFTIADAEPLTARDFVTTGMVALAQSNNVPQVFLEHLFPMSAANVRESGTLLVTGNPIILEKTNTRNDLSAVIHIERFSDGRMHFTVVPLLYSSYGLSGSAGSFSTEPPPNLHIESSLPVMVGPRVDTALKKLAEFRRSQPAVEQGTTGEAPVPKGPQIVRLDAVPDGVKVPETGALPEMPVATPIPIAGRGTATPRKGSPPVAMLSNTPKPVVAPTPVPNLPSGVIKPFIASNPEPGLPGAQGNKWRTYKPGSVPAARAVSPADAATLPDGEPAARTYLRGSFVVTATGENKAVIRPRPGSEGAGTAPVRIIVEYVNGTAPPAEGGSVDRTDATPYEIRDVRRGATGELNIWVREIVQE